MNLGIPNKKMTTCRKILTPTGPLFRSGGFSMRKDGELQLFFLHQIYKNADGYFIAVVESMIDVTGAHPDNFLYEMMIKTWKRSRFV